MDLCRHFATENFYMPSAFYMKLNVTIFFQDDFVKGNRQNMAVFLHEYIHYLQDISTVYGYLQIHNSLEHLVGYLHYAQNCKDSSLQRTILKVPGAERLETLINCTYGNTDDVTYENYDKIEVKDIAMSLTLEEVKDLSQEYGDDNFGHLCAVPRLKLTLKKAHRINEINFDFGANAISESMAYLIQNHVYPTEKNYMQIQYDIAKIFYEFVMETQIDDAFVVELCDVALMDDNPGMFFYSVLYCMKQHRFNPKNIGDIFHFTDTYGSSCIKLFQKNYCNAKHSIKRILKGDKSGFLELQKYTLENLKQGKKCRLSKPTFICDIMKLNQAEAFDYWKRLTFTFRFPLIITHDNECYGGMNPKQEKFNENFYPAYQVLHNILCLGKPTRCDLVDVCKKNIADIVDRDCEEKAAPWNKLANNQMCPLAVLWKMWQLDGKHIDY